MTALSPRGAAADRTAAAPRGGIATTHGRHREGVPPGASYDLSLIQIVPQIQPISAGTQQIARWSQAVTGYVFAGQTPLFQVGAAGAGMVPSSSAEFALTGCLESQ
ncbi:MAG: hypothetical protein B6D46_01570 [Polyangiaceae bacterium UTPRO1]|nr:MAG: hypothetical protein B6D46_01570 [Polyangiaceae bacterium UTPRO1]